MARMAGMARSAVVGITAVVSGLVFTTPASAATTAAPAAAVRTSVAVTAPDTSATAAEARFVALVNASRAQAGRRAYVTSPDLVAVARTQASRMAGADKLAHNPRLSTVVRSYRWVGENVGYGYDVANLHRAFLASPHHRANVLDSQFTQVGIGIAIRDGRIWISEVFRQPAPRTAKAAVKVKATTTKVHLQKVSKGPGGGTFEGVTWAGVTWAGVTWAGVTWAGVTWA